MATQRPQDFKSNLDTQYISELYGINQRQDLDKIQDSASPLLVNISLDKPGTWVKRKGSKLLGATLAGAGTYGLISYTKSDGTTVLRKIANTNLYTYDPSMDTWTSSIASAFTASTKIFAVNFLDRVYYTSPSDYLAYESGTGSLTVVGSGADRIQGSSLAVAQNTLFVAYGAKVYYSLYDNTNNTPTHQLWNTVEGSLANSTRFLNFPSKVIGLTSYAGYCYIFTINACYVFDITRSATSYAVAKVFDIGLCGPRAITQVNGFMIWMSPDGRIWAWGGAGVPQTISWTLEDDENSDAIINNIAAANIPEVAAGSDKNKFFFSVGDITFHGETITNAVLVGHIPQSFSTVLWSIYSYPKKPVVYANATFSNKPYVVFGVSAVSDVYQVGVGSNDGSTAVSATAKTKFFDFGLMMRTKDIAQILIKHRPQSTTNPVYLRLKYALDGQYSYTAFSDPDGVSPVTRFGVVNMYNADTTALDSMDTVNLPPGLNFRSISLEIGNIQSGERFEVSAIGFRISPRTTYDKRIESS